MKRSFFSRNEKKASFQGKEDRISFRQVPILTPERIIVCGASFKLHSCAWIVYRYIGSPSLVSLLTFSSCLCNYMRLTN